MLLPITNEFFSPLYFKSWGGVPIDEKGYIWLFYPIFVLPIIFMWECKTDLAPISTSGPIIQ